MVEIEEKSQRLILDYQTKDYFLKKNHQKSGQIGSNLIKLITTVDLTELETCISTYNFIRLDLGQNFRIERTSLNLTWHIFIHEN
jgi:hypothetical protein